MSNETKRDVFEVAMNHATKSGWVDYSEMMSRYDAALPDDLPVIPKAVSEYIKNLWKYHRDLVDVFGLVRDLGITRTEPNGVLLWVAHNTDAFARAWVLDAWCVEETGEIVKLEAEK
ncbi:hypothetical protein [Lacticaseibacillus nasuensis]|nr:hypothetical protein [Lacticaseibacillus nasuensis]